MGICENVAAVRQIIAESAKKSGRKPEDIRLIGVTKTVDVERIKELLAAGVTEIGENRVQDLLPKYEAFRNLENRPSEWHFIGHLQRNKVKFIFDKVSLIHSIDSLPLAQEINNRASKAGRQVEVLAEINISGETSKFGIPPTEILEFAENLAKWPNIRLVGLMCVAPFVENPDKNRGYFEKMRKISIDIEMKHLYHTKKPELSMGMTGDYSAAIEEGATIVRLGTALFGDRL